MIAASRLQITLVTRRWLAGLGMVLGLFTTTNAQAFSIAVVERGSGSLVTAYTFIVNDDNTGEPLAPDHNLHPSRKPTASFSPIVAAGNQDTANNVTLPPGRYLISVRAEGYKLWGRHITLPEDEGTVSIELLKDPHPLTKVVVHVFEDRQPLNAAPDPLEPGLAGFHVVVEDLVGEVTVDWFGNPLCGGQCVTDANGDLVIENLPHGKYEVEVVPPEGTTWVGTSTLKGTRFLAAWLEEGSDGTRFARMPDRDFLGPEVNWYAFARPTTFPQPGSGTIRGRAVNAIGYPPFNAFELDANEPVPRPYVALNNIGGADEVVHVSQGSADGNFVINNVPPGLYQLVIWDEPRHWIIGYYTLQIADGQIADLGNLGMRRWFGWLSGDVFVDANENALRDAGETGIENIDLLVRNRDGSIKFGTFTDETGHYEFPTLVSPLGRFQVAEVGFGRFDPTGHSVHDEHHLYDSAFTQVFPGDLGGELLASQLTWESRRSIVDWGKRAYQPGENGGISGAVIYATTRNEFDARLAAAEDYEPGVPGVTLRLWALGADGLPNTADDILVNEIVSDSFVHPSAANANACDVKDAAGNLITTPVATEVGEKCIEVPMLGNETEDGAWDGGYAFGDNCLDPTGLSVTVPTGDHDGDGVLNRVDPDLLLNADAGQCAPLTPGDYVVQVVPPPFYQMVKEEDQNTDEGSALVPLIPPPPCVGDMHVVNDSRNPFHGQEKPLCDKRLVTLQDQQNAAADFFVFTDMDTDPTTSVWSTREAVPPPGRIYGLVEDNLVVNTNPNSLSFGELRPVPFVPVGFRDYTGRVLTTTVTDEHGYYEVLLPSTFMANCPVPGGICPGMYEVVPNDPGDIGRPNPNFAGTYKLTTTTWDVWPGKMTSADTPIDPLSQLRCDVLPGDDPVPEIFPGDVPQNSATFSPQIYAVSTPYGGAGTSLTITGLRFGIAQGNGSVTINGVPLTVTSWGNEDITVAIPAGFPAGAGQLEVTIDNGLVSTPGLTFHVIGGGYNPNIVEVHPPVNPADTPIQDAVETSPAGSLIVIHPGAYSENVILHDGISLQGFGQGGVRGVEFPGPRVLVPGSVIDGKFFVQKEVAWRALLATIGFNDNGQVVPAGAAITVVANAADAPIRIDGLHIMAGTGQVGGGIHVHAFADGLIISNNYLEQNQGNVTGGISIGQPSRAIPPTLVDANNDNVRIIHNRIYGNGGTTVGGGIGVFGGADGYEISDNRICGNFSAQYGGGVAHYGLSPNGRIHRNLVYYNDSFDEGGGIIVAGEALTEVPGTTGTGSVTIDRNMIQGNLSNDDGGGIRLLRQGTAPVSITNNMIVHNLAADIGGGIALDDAAAVSIVNNTLAFNVTTATAEDRDTSCLAPPIGPLAGCPHGAGLTSEPHSTLFLASLPAGPPTFSDPVLFNNIFWQNQTYTFVEGTGLVAQGVIDMEVFGTPQPQFFSPRFSLLSTDYAGGDTTNIVGQDPLFITPLAYGVNAIASREANLVTIVYDRPFTLGGNYGVVPGSPVVDAGAPSFSGIAAPANDYDSEVRPLGTAFDIGADEVNTAADNFGPITADVLVTPIPIGGAPVVTLTATASDTTTGSANIAAAEWFIGGTDPGVGAANPLAAADGAFDAPIEALTATISVTGLAPGTHLIHVRSRDAQGNWGAVANPFTLTVNVLDTDADGLPDTADNCIRVANADQRDTDGDNVGNVCDPDLNGDNIVNFADVSIMRAAWLATTADPHYNADADLNGDGTVNFADMAILRTRWLQPPGPSGLVP